MSERVVVVDGMIYARLTKSNLSSEDQAPVCRSIVHVATSTNLRWSVGRQNVLITFQFVDVLTYSNLSTDDHVWDSVFWPPFTLLPEWPFLSLSFDACNIRRSGLLELSTEWPCPSLLIGFLCIICYTIWSGTAWTSISAFCPITGKY